MRKFVKLEELNTDNMLTIAQKCDYQVCVEMIEYQTGLQDAGCLEALLCDGGVELIDTDNNFYYYRLNDIKFKVPYVSINEDEEGYFDTYLLFDLREKI